ncbi:MAG TPA: cysteine desulfurase [Candidatus Olsenella stercoravium]|uniref:cysteine desulfurase n=1 Tax=Candidatus Olsenella stercoravium TaxID=2838713 RepID=A0A9D2DK20_9ACTN|nr:cysteine desulfurase [Candidatus Olsenella stercoravium]
MSHTIEYLDYAASAPMRPEALAAERAYEEAPYAGANPNSLHTMGRAAARALDGARRDVARALGGGFRPADVTFTSGGTESNNLAILGLAEGVRARSARRRRVLLSAIEHDSVLDLAGPLRSRGFEVELIGVGRDGAVDPDALDALLDDTCALVSVMAANNETGVIQPVAELARRAHAHGALFHTDAVQGFCRVPLELAEVDAVSVAAHKIGGPVGVGALAVRGRAPLRPQVFGGGQEQGRRAGTQDVRGALAFAAAARACEATLADSRALVARRASALYERLCAVGTGILPTASALVDDRRLPGIVSVMAPAVDSETLILALDQEGFEVSAASACSSGSLDASHVLLAMGIPRDQALGSLRVSFDERVGEDVLGRFADTLLRIVAERSGARR